jgi:predicted RNA binding protein YcfA (HicA-like mRNA interferase family)
MVRHRYSPKGYNRPHSWANGTKVRDVPKLIADDGWFKVTQKGSHRQFKHAEKPGRVTVAGHPSQEMDKGTLNNILKQAGLK